jgi:nucleotide-binding universal stress UspA family protein
VADATEVLEPVRRFAQQKGWNVQARHVVGQPADVIAETAATGKFDLVVMGSHGRSALGSLVLDSVTSRVLGQCGTPVLIVR